MSSQQQHYQQSSCTQGNNNAQVTVSVGSTNDGTQHQLYQQGASGTQAAMMIPPQVLAGLMASHPQLAAAAAAVATAQGGPGAAAAAAAFLSNPGAFLIQATGNGQASTTNPTMAAASSMPPPPVSQPHGIATNSVNSSSFGIPQTQQQQQMNHTISNLEQYGGSSNSANVTIMGMQQPIVPTMNTYMMAAPQPLQNVGGGNFDPNQNFQQQFVQQQYNQQQYQQHLQGQQQQPQLSPVMNGQQQQHAQQLHQQNQLPLRQQQYQIQQSQTPIVPFVQPVAPQSTSFIPLVQQQQMSVSQTIQTSSATPMIQIAESSTSKPVTIPVKTGTGNRKSTSKTATGSGKSTKSKPRTIVDTDNKKRRNSSKKSISQQRVNLTLPVIPEGGGNECPIRRRGSATSSASSTMFDNDDDGTSAVNGACGVTSNNDVHLTPAERAQQNRDRNREHARSTRLRKKAYVQKLKELVEGLHAERTEEVRQRRVAIQKLSEVQNVRRNVVTTFLKYHCTYEHDERKWLTLLEDTFWLKQPVTPYRSFARSEIVKECRLMHGVAAVINDAASIAVMVEGIGSRSRRWMKIKREEFLSFESVHRGTKQMPWCVERQESRLQHAISSLSSAPDSLNITNTSGSSSSGDDSAAATRQNKKAKVSRITTIDGSGTMIRTNSNNNIQESSIIEPPSNSADQPSGSVSQKDGGSSMGGAHQISSSSGSGSGSGSDSGNKKDSSNDFHDYHAKPMPDPKMAYGDRDDGSNSPSDDSPGEESNDAALANHVKHEGDGKNLPISSDSSSGDDDCSDPHPSKRRKQQLQVQQQHSNTLKHDGSSISNCNLNASSLAKITERGGISDNNSPQEPIGNGAARLHHVAPAIALPPFRGIGKQSVQTNTSLPIHPTYGSGDSSSESVALSNNNNVTTKKNPPSAPIGPGPLTRRLLNLNNTSISNAARNKIGGVNFMNSESSGPAVIFPTADYTSSTGYDGSTNNRHPKIKGHYHVNEDDMILMEDVIMCPFVFRTQDAVSCGAFSECVMPGMLRAHFSSRNKLQSLELVYDAMGFMQQLERASGNEGSAQIVPGSLEMALTPCPDEARVITLAKSPYLIVNVNEVWTKTVGYTQMEVEGKEYLALLESDGTVPEAKEVPGRPRHVLDEVAKGKPACSTNIHYDKDGRDFIEFVCSYPLTNANGEITHLLHVSKELPSYVQEDYHLLQTNCLYKHNKQAAVTTKQ